MTKKQASLLNSFKYALNGWCAFFKSERNARIHLIATVLVIIAGIYFNLHLFEWSLIVIAIGLVMISEMINTVIENTLDFVTKEHHPKIGKIKDIAAGAVLLASLVALIIACLVFLPKVFALFN